MDLVLLVALLASGVWLYFWGPESVVRIVLGVLVGAGIGFAIGIYGGFKTLYVVALSASTLGTYLSMLLYMAPSAARSARDAETPAPLEPWRRWTRWAAFFVPVAALACVVFVIGYPVLPFLLTGIGLAAISVDYLSEWVQGPAR